MPDCNSIDEADRELIAVSSLSQYSYCPRRCALIFTEQLWDENIFTARGQIMHEKVDSADHESRGNVRLEYAVPLRSIKLGLIGRADVIEFHKTEDGWDVFPVEHKLGKPKPDSSDKVQLCAQAMCLEEMMGISIESGALFYGRTRRRLDVAFDRDLRADTETTARLVHELLASGLTPKAEYSAKCKNCSMVELCVPKTGKHVANYIEAMTRLE
ncbi:MAG TPA: CRISPR-associated protein Cas4 [Candidatus Aquicultor sp.]|jgi:CRISPR-associated exonuclease Cas4